MPKAPKKMLGDISKINNLDSTWGKELAKVKKKGGDTAVKQFVNDAKTGYKPTGFKTPLKPVKAKGIKNKIKTAISKIKK